MKAAWRCLLPPLNEFAEAAPLHCLRLDARGAVQERIEVSLAELARRRQGLPVALFLHPRDCRLVSLELPALPAAKLAAAVNCVAEALVLGDPAQLRLAHGPRGADGRLTLGWLEASALASLEQAVQRLRLDVREVQAAPFLLPLRDDAWVAGEWDGHLLLRRSLSDAVVHPLPEQGLAEVPQELRLFWLGERPAWRSAALERAEMLDEALRWSGPASWTTTPANWTWSCCRDRQAAMPLPGRASWASTGCRPMPPTRAGRCAPWKRRQRRPLARQTVALPRRLPMKMNKRLAGLLNTPAQRWSPLLLRLQAYWRQLAPRERKILAGGGLALCLALTWQVFIDPPLARIEHWQAELPRLRAQAAAVDGVLREVEALRGPTLSGTADAEAIRRSLRDQGLDGFQLDAPQPGQWQLDFASVSGEALLRWLARSPAALRLSVSEAQVTRLDAPSEERSGSSNELSGGLVSASIHLQSTSAPKDSP